MKQILLANGKGVVLIDDADYEKVSKYHWFRSTPRTSKRHNGIRFYAYAQLGRRPNRKCVLMHRFILDVEPGVQVDHLDWDGLNNQRENMRLASASNNAAYSINGRGRISLYTEYKGVSFFKKRNLWMARIGNGAKGTSYIGCFKTAEEAARAYDEAAKARFGAFARLNFPEKDDCST